MFVPKPVTFVRLLPGLLIPTNFLEWTRTAVMSALPYRVASFYLGKYLSNSPIGYSLIIRRHFIGSCLPRPWRLSMDCIIFSVAWGTDGTDLGCIRLQCFPLDHLAINILLCSTPEAHIAFYECFEMIAVQGSTNKWVVTACRGLAWHNGGCIAMHGLMSGVELLYITSMLPVLTISNNNNNLTVQELLKNWVSCLHITIPSSRYI